jgi:hypothetical protein
LAFTIHCNSNTLSAQIDGATVGTATNSVNRRGLVGLGVLGFHSAEFQNFRVDTIVDPKP